jgi:hypothetical protein
VQVTPIVIDFDVFEYLRLGRLPHDEAFTVYGLDLRWQWYDGRVLAVERF